MVSSVSFMLLALKEIRVLFERDSCSFQMSANNAQTNSRVVRRSILRRQIPGFMCVITLLEDEDGDLNL